MSCEKHDGCGELVVPQQGLPAGLHAAEVQANLLGFGFSLGEIADVVSKFGPAVLGLVVEGLRAGFGKEWILGTLSKVGEAGLRFVLDLLNQNALFAAAKANGCQAANAFEAVPGVPGEQFGGVLDGALVQLIVEKYLPQIIEKLGPQLIEKFAPKLVEFLLDALMKYFKAPAPQA